jgi:DNA polymerase elongation subunit (family B)
MLVDFEYKNGKLILSNVDKNGNIKLKLYDWHSPTKYMICDETDPDRNERYTTWDGKSVKEVYTKYPNRYAVYEYVDALSKEEKEAIFEYKEPNIFFVDIENEIPDSGKPDPKKAETEIQTISIVNKDKVLVLGSKPLSANEIESIHTNINNHFDKYKTNYDFKYVYYKSEYDLLLNFFKIMVPKMAVITGWNFVHYDWVFLVNRARAIGISPEMSSFTNRLVQSYKDDSELPAHRLVVDYMDLYAKWDTSIKIKESNSLDFVSENILGLKKIHYNGSLSHLYKTDYKTFVFYNAIDSCLVQQIHLKMKYIDILYSVGTVAKIKTLDAFSTLAVTEGILREKMRAEKNVIFCKDDNLYQKDVEIAEEDLVKGGWVKEPVRGMSTWVCCHDFSSLYPTTMREFNISADSYKGQKAKNKNHAIFNGHQVDIDEDDIITLNNAVFKNEDGVVKKVMEDIFLQRKAFKKKMMKANEELKEYEKELKELESSLVK